MQKSFLSLLLAGVTGGLICYGAIEFIPRHQDQATNSSLHQTSMTTPIMVGPDFTVAAELGKKAVVLIEAAESATTAQKRYDSDPMNRFFKEFGGFGGFGGFDFGGPMVRRGAGSGVIISSDGYILTNNHVVSFAEELEIKTSDGNSYTGKIIGRDPGTDLAVVKIDAKGLSTIEIANSDNLKVGEWVLAIGNPFEYLTSTVTAGIVSAIGRNVGIIPGNKTIEEFIQTDAAINTGNSGGALVDAYGKLVGINTAIASETGSYAGYSFAIPSNLAMRIAKDIMDKGGDIERTSLGVQVFTLNTEFAKQQNVALTEGLLVESVADGSSAQYAGIQPLDILVEVNGKKLLTFGDLKKKMDSSSVGEELKLKVYRDGKYLDIPVRLKKSM